MSNPPPKLRYAAAVLLVADLQRSIAFYRDKSFIVGLRYLACGREFYVKDPDGYILGFIQSA